MCEKVEVKCKKEVKYHGMNGELRGELRGKRGRD
jgi:hypothetical protein